MKKIIVLLILALITQIPALQAQNPKGWDDMDQIIALRADLKKMLQINNTKRGAVITDSLRDLSAYKHWGLLWDERWLLYHWTGRHQLLLEEVAQYTESKRLLEEYSTPPPSDSLFNRADQIMYARTNTYPALLKELNYTQEVQDFLMLHLQYLLRDNSDNEQLMREDFINRYPQSQYLNFIKNNMTLPPKPRQHWFSWEGAFLNEYWQGELQGHVNPGFGGFFALTYHKKKWHIGANYAVSRQKLSHTINQANITWPKGEKSAYNDFNLSFGYEMRNLNRFRFSPYYAIGWASFYSPTATDENGDPIDNIYEDFDYGAFSQTLGFCGDIKIKKRSNNPRNLLPPSYSGVRIRAGYSLFNWGRENNQLAGGALFLTVGYQLSGTW